MWQRHFINLLMLPLRPSDASSSSSALPAPPPPLSCSSLVAHPRAMDDLVVAMDAWGVQAPAQLLQQLTVGEISRRTSYTPSF